MTTQEAINEAIARGHDALEHAAPTLLDRLRNAGRDREPFTPEHAKCICRLTNEAAAEIDRLNAESQLLHLVAGTLAVHVKGHFALATETSPEICQHWAEMVQKTIADQEAR